MNNTAKKPIEKRNGFVRFLHYVFVKNIGYKILAIVLGVAVALLSVGLSI